MIAIIFLSLFEKTTKRRFKLSIFLRWGSVDIIFYTLRTNILITSLYFPAFFWCFSSYLVTFQKSRIEPFIWIMEADCFYLPVLALRISPSENMAEKVKTSSNLPADHYLEFVCSISGPGSNIGEKGRKWLMRDTLKELTAEWKQSTHDSNKELSSEFLEGYRGWQKAPFFFSFITNIYEIHPVGHKIFCFFVSFFFCRKSSADY